MVSLRERVDSGKLPRHWYMDLNTLNRIKRNKPNFNTSSIFKSNFVSRVDRLILELKNFIPDSNWFLVREEINTIHGIRHLLRVNFLSMLLITLDKTLPLDFLKMSAITSSLHDLRRRNDLLDVGHAKRGAKWFIKNVSMINKFYNIELTEEEIDTVYYSILFHDIPYKKIFDDPNYKKYKVFIDITKTADALDRYRLPKVDWWIKDHLVSFKPSDDFKHVAYQLVVSSETHFLNGLDGATSVFKALNNLKNLEI
jgi:hypothetical protein